MRTIISVLLILFVCNVYGSDKPSSSLENMKNKNSATISGKVVDKYTGEPLVGVQVELIGTDKKVFTDFDGNFSFDEIQKGAYAIIIKYISYNMTVENVYANDNKENSLYIKLASVEK